LTNSAEHQVIVEPVGATFFAKHGEMLMRAAERAGLRWPTVCRGNGQCGTCYGQILLSGNPLPPPSAAELSLLRTLPPAMRENARLACQLPVTATLTVLRRGVRAPD